MLAISLIPLEIPYPQPPVLFFSGIAQYKRGFFFFHLILVDISSILILSVKNRGVVRGGSWAG